MNLISALKTLKGKYGDNFALTMAPETFFVQLAATFYGSGDFGGQDPRAGSFIPVIHALRDELTILHVQDYNSGRKNFITYIVAKTDDPQDLSTTWTAPHRTWARPTSTSR